MQIKMDMGEEFDCLQTSTFLVGLLTFDFVNSVRLH